MIDYATILTRKYKAEWSLNGDDYEGLTWLSDSPKPTKAELDALWDDVKKEIATDKANAIAKKQALLDKLGITEEEANLLFNA